ncbi:efflux RND transporter permease subunit [Kosmotoga pacifica]|uniref:SSD domain-containing protein n=1 Tax=Kosmotoga pacifica TaxID=1330330 RepID=A0A0G2ZG32_9BACT|nr:efflux RND transporter permease subunit [Kosmotoga pacifica]AKI97773.1 hypothetical protein IX53_08055 [Kosmotoga pacifica]
MSKKTSTAVIISFVMLSIIVFSFLPGLSYGSTEELTFREGETSDNLPDKLLIIVKTPNILNPDNSVLLYNVVKALKQVDGVLKVNSIFDAADISLRGLSIDGKPYFNEGIPEKNASEILTNPLYVGNLIDSEGKVAFIALDVKAVDLHAVEEILNELPKSFEYNMTGTPVVDYGIEKSVNQLIYIFPPVLFFLMWLIYFFRLGDARAALLPPLFAALAAGWTYAIAAIIGIKLNILTSTVGLFVIVVSSSYGLHVIDRYLLFRSKQGHTGALVHAIKDEAPSLFLSALTTAVGFLTFLFSSMAAMKELGLLVSLGVGFSFVFSLFVIPAFISLIDFKTHHSRLTVKFKLGGKTGVMVSAILFILLLISPFFIKNLKVNSDQFGFFKKGSEIVKSAETSREYFGWVVPFYVKLHKVKGSFTAKDAPVIENILSDLNSVEGVRGTNSIMDIVDSFNVPLPIMMIFSRSEQGREILSEFVDGDTLRIMVKTPQTDAIGAVELKRAIDEVMQKYPQYDYIVSSPLLNFASLNTNTSKNQILTIFTAFGMIFLLLLVIFRSFRLTLIAIVPIVGTTILNFAYMTVFGLTLDIGTSIVAGMLMGLIIDYSIHLMLRYRILRKHYDKPEAIQKAMDDIGPVIVASGLSLVAGFSSLFFTPMKIYSDLAILLVLGVATGVVMTLFIVPTLLSFSITTKVKTPTRKSSYKGKPIISEPASVIEKRD